MRKRILVISWFYPPVTSSEGLVTYKLISASQYEYDVFTQKNSTLWSYGNKDYLPESKNVNTIFANANNLEEWVKEAIEYYKQNKEKYDVIMTRSMPPESHKIGQEIKTINPNIKWIASFGDPIADNPYTKIALNYKSPHSIANCRSIKGVISPKRIVRQAIFKIRYKKQRKEYLDKDAKLQENVIKKANYLIFNSEYQKEYMLQKYEETVKEKAVVLYHSFNEKLYPEAIEKKEQKIKMTYIGLLDSIRNPSILFKAIKELYDKDKDLSKKIVFEFYGTMSDEDKLFIINNDLVNIIKIKKSVNYLESLKIMQESDWLLQIDANISEVNPKNIFFAAKLADYIGTGNKIFGITMPEGISADILRKLNAVVTTYSVENVKNYLWLIIYKNYNIEMNKEYREQFSNINVAKKLDNLIQRI